MDLRQFTLLIAAGLIAVPSQAQQVTVTTPSNQVGSSFYENINFNFGFNIPGGRHVVGIGPDGRFTSDGSLQFRQNLNAPPPFGGFTPGGGANLGLRLGGAQLGLSFDQGASTTLSSQSASVTVPNGGTGFFSATTLRPFVTGFVPVVGGFAGNARPNFLMPGPVQSAPLGNTLLQERLSRLAEQRPGPREPVGEVNAAAQALAEMPGHHAPQADLMLIGPGETPTKPDSSTAQQPAASIASIQRQQAIAQASEQAEIAELFERGDQALREGKVSVARLYFQMVARQGEGRLKATALERLAELRKAGQ